MAGDWIKMRVELQTHPKVVRISSACHADTFRTIGGLHAAWSMFDQQSIDGTLPGVTLDAFDFLIRWPGFSKAMEDVGWLVETEEGIEMPRFDSHTGKGAKRRVMEMERKRSARMGACDADKKRTDEQTKSGPEKEKEKDVNTPIPPKGGLDVVEEKPKKTRRPKTGIPDSEMPLLKRLSIVIDGQRGPRYSPSKAWASVQAARTAGIQDADLERWWTSTCKERAAGKDAQYWPTFHVVAKPQDIKFWIDSIEDSNVGHDDDEDQPRLPPEEEARRYAAFREEFDAQYAKKQAEQQAKRAERMAGHG